MSRAFARPSPAVVVAFLAALLACATRRVPEMRYYTLSVPGTPAALPEPVHVGRFAADEAYATARLAYRSSPYRIDYYVYHRWAADPRSLMAGAARDYLARAPVAGEGPPLELVARIRRLEEVDDEAGRRGALALEVEVRRGGALVLARGFEAEEPAAGAGPEAVVAALSRAVGRVLDEVIAALPR
jgi:ABC-type uncharacterized transport system auxiliary subunit